MREASELMELMEKTNTSSISTLRGGGGVEKTQKIKRIDDHQLK